jgi:hypothetical protein
MTRYSGLANLGLQPELAMFKRLKFGRIALIK